MSFSRFHSHSSNIWSWSLCKALRNRQVMFLWKLLGFSLKIPCFVWQISLSSLALYVALSGEVRNVDLNTAVKKAFRCEGSLQLNTVVELNNTKSVIIFFCQTFRTHVRKQKCFGSLNVSFCLWSEESKQIESAHPFIVKKKKNTHLSLIQSVHLRSWTQKHPWQSWGGVANHN